MEATESIDITRRIYELVQAKAGAKADELLEAVGLTPDTLYQSHCAVPAPLNHTLCQLAARVSGDPHFGMHLAAAPSRWDFPAWAAACRSPNLLASLRMLESYSRMVTGVLRWDFTVKGELFSIAPKSRLEVDVTTPQSIETMLAYGWCFVRQCFGPGIRPTTVRFRHAPQGERAEYERVFCAPVEFEREEDELLFAEHWMRAAPLPLPRATNSEPDQIDGSVTRRAAEVLQASPSLSADEVARRLTTSRRTLERWLAGEGTSFRRIKDDVQRSRAIAALRAGKVVPSKLGLELGFVEPRGFYRAFRRWTGSTPAEFLRDLEQNSDGIPRRGR